jgi:hypothetical protein
MSIHGLQLLPYEHAQSARACQLDYSLSIQLQPAGLHALSKSAVNFKRVEHSANGCVQCIERAVASVCDRSRDHRRRLVRQFDAVSDCLSYLNCAQRSLICGRRNQYSLERDIHFPFIAGRLVVN